MLNLDKRRLGTLAFNLCAIGWIALNLGFVGNRLIYAPGTYVSPNWINFLGGLVFIPGTILAVLALRKGNVIHSVLALTLAWAFTATLIRALTE